jgi:hypothetical protein
MNKFPISVAQAFMPGFSALPKNPARFHESPAIGGGFVKSGWRCAGVLRPRHECLGYEKGNKAWKLFFR